MEHVHDDPSETTGGLANIKLVIEYDGTDFHGSQVQAGQRTVQGELERALRQLTQEKVQAMFSGRTDSGVHAIGQVVNFRTSVRHDTGTYVRALNAILPKDVAVRQAEEVEPGFHSRYSARSREYRYTILNAAVPSPILRRYALHVAGKLDLAAMSRACQVLVGRHDFASFTGAGRGVPDQDSGIEVDGGDEGDTVREIYHAGLDCSCRLPEESSGRLVELDISANAFLPHMMRNIVGTLLLVGRGKIDWLGLATVLRAKDRRLAGPTAGPHGLCLMKVVY